ncbi:unnamed protein product [Linum tenue]|uniref:Uncharacterized protein n=1 Tax=Linum tenue TaxID=586396 RepID=A0AAV0RW70_9ROSI|nr:unnamed protein product [Linum tenue]CAI0560433.1 unnamed protein product [Linum tenue]
MQNVPFQLERPLVVC